VDQDWGQNGSQSATLIPTVYKTKENDYEEGQDQTKESVMFMEENKYKSLIRTGEWNVP